MVIVVLDGHNLSPLKYPPNKRAKQHEAVLTSCPSRSGVATAVTYVSKKVHFFLWEGELEKISLA